jgi:hypothetical protein
MIVFTFALLTLNSAFALSINIDPSNIKLTLKPGSSANGEIAIQNLGGDKIGIKAYTEDWVYAADGSKSFMKPGSSVYSCSSWIKLEPENFDLAPKEVRKVKYTISSPGKTSGGHVSVIFFESAATNAEGISVAGRIGTIVYLDTEGDIKRSGEIKAFSALTSEEDSPIDFSLSFNNTGNTYLSAKPTIKITSNDKTVIEDHPANINTLPGDSKTTSITINKPLLNEGHYKAQVELNFEDKTLSSQTEFTIKKASK